MAGTLYWIIQPAATADPSGAQVKDGLDGSNGTAFASGNQAAPASTTANVTGSQVTNFSGGADYEEFWCWSDGVTTTTPVKYPFTTPVAFNPAWALRATSMVGGGINA